MVLYNDDNTANADIHRIECAAVAVILGSESAAQTRDQLVSMMQERSDDVYTRGHAGTPHTTARLAFVHCPYAPPLCGWFPNQAEHDVECIFCPGSSALSFVTPFHLPRCRAIETTIVPDKKGGFGFFSLRWRISARWG